MDDEKKPHYMQILGLNSRNLEISEPSPPKKGSFNIRISLWQYVNPLQPPHFFKKVMGKRKKSGEKRGCTVYIMASQNKWPDYIYTPAE